MRDVSVRWPWIPVCAAALGGAAWLSVAGTGYAQTALHDASTSDASVEARADTGVRCFPIGRDEDGGAPDAARADAAVAADVSDASARCPLPRAVIDRAEHCCLPGQAWRGGSCAGVATSCAPGETRAAGGACAPRVTAAGDAGVSARLYEAPRAAVGAAMAVVPGGVFRFGNAWVSVGPFAIDRVEVTAEAYARCVVAGVCPQAPDPYGQMTSRATAPAVNVSWEMARRYCGWAGQRLPTEAEWELAARGLDGRRYPWGERAPDCSLARHAGCGDAPLRVGALPAGRGVFGLLDAAGNAAEWVADAYGPRPSRDDGRVTADPTGPSSGAQRVVRGGSFLSNPQELTSEARRGVDAREMRGDVGFRCARGL